MILRASFALLYFWAVIVIRSSAHKPEDEEGDDLTIHLENMNLHRILID